MRLARAANPTHLTNGTGAPRRWSISNRRGGWRRDGFPRITARKAKRPKPAQWAQVIYSDEASTDFERIIEFLLQTSPEAAAQALDNIRSTIGILEAHPFIRRSVDDDIRELVIRRADSH